jgi:uncharacterized protein (DUF885 family)
MIKPLTTAAGLALLGIAAHLAAQTLDLSASPLRPYIDSFTVDRIDLLRYYNVELSATRAERMRRFYSEWQDRLAHIDFNALPQDGKVDYVLFRNYLAHELKRIDFDAKSLVEAGVYIPFTKSIVDLEEARQKTAPMKAQDAAAKLTELAAEIQTARKTAEQGLHTETEPHNIHMRRVLGNRASEYIATLRNTLRTWYTFYYNYDPLFTWWASEGYKSADTALQSYAGFLREHVAMLPAPAARPGASDDIIGNPIGREALMSELQFEMIPYTPEELIAIANKEYAWCENEMKRASREMGFGDDWKKALEKVKTMYVEPGKQPELIRTLAREAEKFLDDHDLVTVPSIAHETWRMQMMTPERQLVNPFFTGGETISVSYPVASMSYEQKMMTMRGNNIPFSRATVFHELIPGHELQGYMASHYRTYRSAIGGTPFLVEGWSLYWELLLYEMRFQQTPEDRVGALFWRMHRCARIIFSLSFHLGKMTPEECINLLVDRVGHERENAAGEVRRSFGGSYSPLYQAAYLLCGMQLYALHKELVVSGKMTNRQFHDAVLKENRIPIELIRADLTTQKLSRDFTTTWKFYGDNP